MSSAKSPSTPALASKAATVDYWPIVSRVATAAAVSVAIALPLSISLTYITLILGLLLFLIKPKGIYEVIQSPLFKPLAVLLVCGALCAIFGIHPTNSLIGIVKLACLLLAVAFLVEQFKVFGASRFLPIIMLSSSVAAFHSLLESAYPGRIGRLFVGTVTESGQLAILIPCLTGLIFALNLELQNSNNSQRVRFKANDLLQTFVGLLVFAGLGFSNYLDLPKSWKLVMLTLATTFFAISLGRAIWQIFSGNFDKAATYRYCIRIAAPLLTCAWLVNMKRGPWVGVTVALLIFFFFYHRRLIVPCILGLLAVVFTIAPIGQRLSQSSHDFFILGGRSTIWEVGTELAIQYPLGIGFENSSFLRQFAPEVPPELVHFHSNFLNILVEFGWIGLLIYLWWLFEVLRFCFAERRLDYKSLLARGIGCGIIAWQVAGVVEYNFGDSEILILVLFLLALVYANNGTTLEPSLQTSSALPVSSFVDDV